MWQGQPVHREGLRPQLVHAPKQEQLLPVGVDEVAMARRGDAAHAADLRPGLAL